MSAVAEQSALRLSMVSPEQGTLSSDASAPTRECSDAVAAARVLSVATDLHLLAELGSSVALLVFAIQTCGLDGVCHTSYAEVAERCGVHEKTVQNWLAKLGAKGWITRTPKGIGGVEVKISTERMGEVKPEKSALSALADIENGLLYGRAALAQVFETALATVRKARN
jgi:hypothetical protein